MGAIAERFVAYAQPLIDETDGSPEQLKKALSISQMCFTLAQLPDDKQQSFLNDARQELGMDDQQFDELRQSVIEPMLRRHKQMFPLMHRRASTGQSFDELGAKAVEKYPGTDRYAPCPCNSGKKYKFCCGKRGR